MATDLSTSAIDLFSGRRRARLIPTLLIATAVTAVVAIPLLNRAVDSRNNPEVRDLVIAPASADAVMVDTAQTDPRPLDMTTIDGPVLISVSEPAASAVSFNLFAAGADQPVIESLDLIGPQFDFVVDDGGRVTPFDSTMLSNGDYELFITIRTPQEDRRTAVSFEVRNP